MTQSFEDWMREVRAEAKAMDCSWLIHDDDDQYREFYDDDHSPLETVEIELSYCKE